MVTRSTPRGSIAIGLALALCVGIVVASPAQGASDPTEVTSLSVAPSTVPVGTPVEASGAVRFGPDDGVIATDPVGDVGPHQAALGMDLTGLSIASDPAQPNDMIWTFDLDSLPPGIEGTPEAVFYWWAFTIGGGDELALDARRTNVYRQASTNPFFRVRTCPGGACTDVSTPSGVFDQPASQVRATLKVNRLPGASAGATLTFGDIESSYGTGARWVYGLGDQVVPDEGTYRIPWPDVRAGLARSGTQPNQFTPADVTGSGPDREFAVSVPTAGRQSGSYELVVEACWGGNCGTARRNVTLT